MKKYIIPILCAIVLGYICASFILEEYKEEDNSFNRVFFLQIGVYNTLEHAKEEYKNINNIKIIKENNKYYSYIGITSNIDNANKIKKLYKDLGINIYIKEDYINNNSFIYDLQQYDVLIESLNTKEEIDKVLESIISSYENNVLVRG